MTQSIELRQYTLHVGMRETLIELFDRALTRGQEQLGMSVLGQFRDLDDPNKFVWVRGFKNLDDRARALADFYDGPVWAEHSRAANATMVDSTDVLLLEPAELGASFDVDHASPRGGGFVEASVLELAGSAPRGETLDFFRRLVAPGVGQGGGSLLGYFFTETRANNFPRLPVREEVNALVWFAGFTEAAYTDPELRSVRRDIAAAAGHAPGACRGPHLIRLVPTSHSRLAGSTPACALGQTINP